MCVCFLFSELLVSSSCLPTPPQVKKSPWACCLPVAGGAPEPIAPTRWLVLSCSGVGVWGRGWISDFLGMGLMLESSLCCFLEKWPRARHWTSQFGFLIFSTLATRVVWGMMKSWWPSKFLAHAILKKRWFPPPFSFVTPGTGIIPGTLYLFRERWRGRVGPATMYFLLKINWIFPSALTLSS